MLMSNWMPWHKSLANVMVHTMVYLIISCSYPLACDYADNSPDFHSFPIYAGSNFVLLWSKHPRSHLFQRCLSPSQFWIDRNTRCCDLWQQIKYRIHLQPTSHLWHSVLLSFFAYRTGIEACMKHSVAHGSKENRPQEYAWFEGGSCACM